MEDISLVQLSELSYPILLLNNENEFVWCNKNFRTLHKPQLDSGIPIEDIVIGHIVPILDTKEYESIKKEKHNYFSILESIIIVDDKKHKFLSFFDISKRHELTKKLSEKQKMFESLSENLPEGIVLYNEKIIYTNPAFEKIINQSGKELKNKNFVDLFLTETKSELITSMNEMLIKPSKKSETITQIDSHKTDSKYIKIKTQSIKFGNDINFLSIVTDITKRIQNDEKLNLLAYVDALTSIYNRRKFDEIFKMEYSRSKRYHRNLSALFFDIDHFKKVNDNYGHDIGDEVLKTLSELVKLHIRETDFFARWGGEEFIILLPETNLDEASTIAEHIRTKVETNVFNKVGKVTISIGCTMLKEKEQRETFKKRLDNLLYKAKNEGRNRVVKQV